MDPDPRLDLGTRYSGNLEASRAFRSTRRSLTPIPASADPGLHDLLVDLLRVEIVGEAYHAAHSAVPGAAGEPGRLPFRALAEAYLRHATREARHELDERRLRCTVPEAGFEAGLALAEFAQERRALYRAWRGVEESLAAARAALHDAENDAARRVGASSAREYAAAAQPREMGELEAMMLRGAIEPLDGAIEAAGRERWRRCRSLRVGAGSPEDVPALTAMRDHHASLPWSGILPILRRIGGVMGADPDSFGPRILTDAETGAWTRGLWTGDGPVVLTGRLDGPVALSRSLEVWARAFRAAFLHQVDPQRARWCDPALAHATGVLFRRLPLQPSFRRWCGLEERSGLAEDLRFEEAVAPRLDWGYLSLTGPGRATQERAAEPERIDAVIRRASARPATPEEIHRAAGRGPGGATAIRGTILGILLEERLMTRYGRDWYLDRAVRRDLLEIWEGEPGQTAESMASALALGTIHASPILDRCRP